MSAKKSKLDLIVRTRFQNPLPPPPFPPKLLNIETDIKRYADYAFSAPLVGETPHPVIVDAEAGMPLDLSCYSELWDEEDEEGGLVLNAEDGEFPELDPEDAELLIDPPWGPLPAAVGTPVPGTLTTSGSMTPVAAAKRPEVSWLRRTEYISSEAGRRDLLEKLAPVQIQDDSREGQIKAILHTFRFEPSTHNPAPAEELAAIRNPTKPHLHAVEVFDVLPDPETWSNQYYVIRFSEDPGTAGYDPRVENGLIRPVISEDNEQWLSYYLPEDEEQNATLLRKRSEPVTGDEDQERATFTFIRDYEIVAQTMSGNDLMLNIDDGLLPGAYAGAAARKGKGKAFDRGKGAFYKIVQSRMALKKRRPKKDASSDSARWDKVHLGLEDFEEEEINDRAYLEELFLPPGTAVADGGSDAEGEPEIGAAAQ